MAIRRGGFVAMRPGMTWRMATNNVAMPPNIYFFVLFVFIREIRGKLLGP